MNNILLLAALLAAPVEAEKPAVHAAEPIPAASIRDASREPGPVFRIAENSAAGAAVGTISAPGGTVTEGAIYSITSGNHDGTFAIDPRTGTVSVKNGGALDFEAHPSFKLGVELKSPAGESDKLRNSFAEQLKKTGADSATVAKLRENIARGFVTVELTDVNEPPTLPMQSWTARSDSPTGTIFGKLSATDPDQGDRLKYSTNEDATSRFFVVDPDSGEIAVRDPAALSNALDGRTVGAFVAEFLVTDSAGNTKTTKFPITLEGPATPPVSEQAASEQAASEQTAPEVAATEPGPQQDPAEMTLEEILTATALPGSAGDFVEEAKTVAASKPVPQPQRVSTTYRLVNLAVMFAVIGFIYYLYQQSRKPGSMNAFARAPHLSESRPVSTIQTDFFDIERSRLFELKSDLEQHQLQIAAERQQLQMERAELHEASGRVQADREKVEVERQLLVEVEAGLNVQRHDLASKMQELSESQSTERHSLVTAEEHRLAEVRKSIQLEESRLAVLKAELDRREEQNATQKSELEAERAALLETSSRIKTDRDELESQRLRYSELEAELETERRDLETERRALAKHEREDLENDRRELADQQAERHHQRNVFSERMLELDEVRELFETRPMDSVDAAEKLVDIAAADFAGTPSEPESVEVLELRHRLADMFGVSDTELARHRSSSEHEHTEPPPGDRRSSHSSFETVAASSAPAPEPIAVAELPAQPTEESAHEESIDTYMRSLLERQRYRQQYGSSAASEMETTRVVAPAGQRVAIEPVPVVEAVPEKPVSTSPIHPQDKDAVRNDLAALRTVANQAARSAVLRHTKKRLRNHSMIKISCAAASFVTAGMVFSTHVAATTVLGWAAAGIGGIMLIDLAHWTYVQRKTSAGKSKD